MATNINLSVVEYKGTYVTEGNFIAVGDYVVVSGPKIASYSGTVQELGRFSATRNGDSMMYRIDPLDDEYADNLMMVATAIRDLLEAKFAPSEEEQAPAEQE